MGASPVADARAAGPAATPAAPAQRPHHAAPAVAVPDNPAPARPPHAGEAASRAALGVPRPRAAASEADGDAAGSDPAAAIGTPAAVPCAPFVAAVAAPAEPLAPAPLPDPGACRFQNQRINAREVFGWTDSAADHAPLQPARKRAGAADDADTVHAAPPEAGEEQRSAYLAMAGGGAAALALRAAVPLAGAALRMVRPRSRIECMHRCGAHGMCDPDSANGCGGTWCGQLPDRV